MAELDRGGHAELAEAGNVLLGESCACSIRCRSPSGAHSPRVSSNASSASRFARSPIACTATGQPARAPRADDLHELLPARDLDAGPVQHARRLRAERAVHERLQVADPQQVVAEPGAEAELLEPPDMVVRKRLPDAQRERAVLGEPLPEARRAEPAVLVVDRRHAARGDDLQARRASRRRTRRRTRQVAVAELPGRLLAEDARRLAVLVELDDAARDLEVAVRGGERRRVEPERVVVAGHQRGRRVAGHRVERLPGRLDRGRPVAAPPAPAAEPAARLGTERRPSTRASASSSEDVPSRRTSRCASAQRRKVDVRVAEAREDAAAAEVRHGPARRAPSRAFRPRLRPGRRRSPSAMPTGIVGSIVRMTPFSRITTARM